MKPGDWVRVRPVGGNPNYGGGKVIAIVKNKITIQPICHGMLEVVDAARCRLWKSRNGK